MLLRFFILLIAISLSLCGEAKTIFDSSGADLTRLFKDNQTRYVLRYPHVFSDTLKLPVNCELLFDGGTLSGPIVFNGTKLSGNVNLKGSSIKGSIRNKTFEADWLCYKDGKTDDAKNINEMIFVCSNIHFSKGQYRLKSKFNPTGMVEKTLYSQIQTHIGINKSNVKLVGDEGAELLTDVPVGTIFVFSKPNQIENSIKNIEISGLTFTVHNDGKEFHEFMHTVKSMGVNGMTIKNCRFNDFWGDAICLSHYGDDLKTGERTRNQNVRIIGNTIVGGNCHNNRNGISVINGKNILIKENIIRNTSREDMPGGIDIEPNNAAYTIENIQILKNRFEGILGNGGAISVCMFNGGPGHRIYIEGNHIRNSKKGIYIYIKTENTTDNLIIKDNYIADDTHPYEFVGHGKSEHWTICGNTFERPCFQNIPGNIKVNNLVVKNNKKKLL